MELLGVERNYASLSLRDLLEARDLYHYHLIHKANVVGTAIGLYLIRKTDPWPDQDRTAQQKDAKAPRGERTLYNSEVRDYSWPCVQVFVKDWVEAHRFGTSAGELHPESMIPRTLYMPDGRMVPVCVIKVSAAAPSDEAVPDWQWPRSRIGGGFPIVTQTQGERRVASVGCLVTDGHTVYALTSRHVTGPAGLPLYSMLAGEEVMVGKSSAKQLTRLPFAEVYADFPARRTYLTLDVGLVEIADLGDWTSQVYGLGDAGALADLSERNISLRLIGAVVVGHGAASGPLSGRIQALFYRHRSVGGYDDVADFLIAPATDAAPQTRPGDSGTVWHLEQTTPTAELRPLAVQWGGQTFVDGDRGSYNFALAASLSNVCRLLDVELVRAHNTGGQPYWGTMGHYSIATYACELVGSPKLKRLIGANLDRISFKLLGLSTEKMAAALKDTKENRRFVPLADVPDIVWKKTAKQMKGGRDPSPGQGPEHPVHYADIDAAGPDGKTLRALCLEDTANVSVEAWQRFYDATGMTQPRQRGLLPFRVWQFFDAMVAAVRAGDMASFVCAAGLVSHYVGDACQPLHGSVLADGYEDGRGEGVHSAYETKMLDHWDVALHTGISNAMQGGLPLHPLAADGHACAVAMVRLMDRAAGHVPPADLVDAYIDAGGGASRRVTGILWDRFGDGTVQTMVDGAVALASLWESAWAAGGGEATVPEEDAVAIAKARLRGLYEKPAFVRSLYLDEIGGVLR
ncbi:S1/P1 Nuclease [Variovorax sp. KK3]|uniref:S1/P1 Nuclease n=1 Tax=Variovorax sp. KK3 TaxID=1855728 RepID=UPI00097C794A|nr:S1/P1 Nuclease [Variovorax sp. KK3]